MAIDVVLGVLLALGILGLVGLVVRKLPVLRVIDISHLVKPQQQTVKHDLAEARFRRNLARKLAPLLARFSPRHLGLGRVLQSVEDRLKQQIDERTSPEVTVAELLARAEEALKEGRSAEAEKAFLEALRHNPNELKAYQGLGVVYLETREYEQAREVYEYLARRGSEQTAHLGLARVAWGQGHLEEAQGEYLKTLAVGSSAVQPHLELARILRELGEVTAALEQLSAARALEPRNPKILDFYVELSILNGQPTEAQAALDALREVNPDNQKIPELAQEIRQLAQKLKPKRLKPKPRATDFGVPTR